MFLFFSIDGNSFGPPGVHHIIGDHPSFGGPGGPGGHHPGHGGATPGDHPSALLGHGPPFHGNEGGLGHHMMPPGGHNGGPGHPPGGPSPPMQNLPPLGGPIGAGIDGMMDLQQVGQNFISICLFKVQIFRYLKKSQPSILMFLNM